MRIIAIAKMRSKGLITIPNRVRKLLHLQKGSSIAFRVRKDSVMLLPCEATRRSPYTPKEWQKIEKMASEKGKVFSDDGAAKKHLRTVI